MIKFHFDELSMKQCSECKTSKTLVYFYKHKGMKCGYLNKCIECIKTQVRNRRFGPNREKILKYDRERGNRSPAQYNKEYRIKNKEKYRAHILSQRIPKRPCEICGINKNIHRHHDDYSKPKEVRFLCAEHHRQHHAGLL